MLIIHFIRKYRRKYSARRYFVSQHFSHSLKNPIQSIKDPMVVRVRKLETLKGREELSEFLVEDVQQLQIGLSTPGVITDVLVPMGFDINKLLEAKLDLKLNNINYVNRGIFEKIYLSAKKPELIGIAKIRKEPISSFYGFRDFLIIDGVSDPGNIGSIIRTTSSFGIKGIFFLNQSLAEIYSRRTVRASMGAIFHVKLVTGSLAELVKFCKEEGVELIATSLKGRPELDCMERIKKVGIVLGNETTGVSQKLLQAADKVLKIPMENEKHIDSLNVSVAAGVLLYERRRHTFFAENSKNLILNGRKEFANSFSENEKGEDEHKVVFN